MPRLIEIQDVSTVRAPLAIAVGDILVLRAFGVRVESGPHVVEAIGPFTPAQVGSGGEVLAPMGAPNTVMVRARQPGDAVLTVLAGDPFHAPSGTPLRISVQT